MWPGKIVMLLHPTLLSWQQTLKASLPRPEHPLATVVLNAELTCCPQPRNLLLSGEPQPFVGEFAVVLGLSRQIPETRLQKQRRPQRPRPSLGN
jgi:hypothetical protein